jgi:hypothetical protein
MSALLGLRIIRNLFSQFTYGNYSGIRIGVNYGDFTDEKYYVSASG